MVSQYVLTKHVFRRFTNGVPHFDLISRTNSSLCSIIWVLARLVPRWINPPLACPRLSKSYLQKELAVCSIESQPPFFARFIFNLQLANQAQVKVLHPSWLIECWNQQKLVRPAKPFILPPFAGLMIGVTGLTPCTLSKKRLGDSFYSYSWRNWSPGTGIWWRVHSKSNKEVHSSFEQQSYRNQISVLPPLMVPLFILIPSYALEWGIHCVTTQWFFDSINANVSLFALVYFLPYHRLRWTKQCISYLWARSVEKLFSTHFLLLLATLVDFPLPSEKSTCYRFLAGNHPDLSFPALILVVRVSLLSLLRVDRKSILLFTTHMEAVGGCLEGTCFLFFWCSL